MKQKLDVLETAARLAAEEGSEALTIDRLAELSGVSRSTIYRRHGGRAGIISRLREQGVEIAPRESSRARILSAVAELVGRQGFIGATIADIASQARVSAVTIFRIFDDRDTLLTAFLNELSTEMDEPRTSHGGELPLRTALLERARIAIDRARTYPGLARIALGPLLADDGVFRSVQLGREQTCLEAVEFFGARIAAGEHLGASPRVAAGYWLAALDAEGLVLPGLDDDASASEGAERATEKFLRAMAFV